MTVILRTDPSLSVSTPVDRIKTGTISDVGEGITPPVRTGEDSSRDQDL